MCFADRATRIVAAREIGLNSDAATTHPLDFARYALRLQRLAELARRVQVDIDDGDVGPRAASRSA